MEIKAKDVQDRRLEKLKAENETLRRKLSSVGDENMALRKSLAERDSIFNALPGGLLVIQQEKIIDINKTALEQLGYKAEEVLGRPFLSLVHSNYKAFVKKLHKNRASGKWAPKRYEAALVSKAGGILGCDVRVKKIRLNGRNAFLVRLAMIERRKKREKEVSQAKKMEALITMASGLTSRLGPPVQVIADRVGSLKREEESGRRAVLGGLDQIASAADQIMDTARSLRSLAKMRHERAEVTLLDPKRVVKEAIGLCASKVREEAERRGVKINLKTYLRSISAVEGHAQELQNVIASLICNAVEAMPNGGDLYLSTEESAGYAYIYIQDSGVGIPEDLEDRILDPFYTTKADQGMGLGLSLSSAVIRRHCGTLEITSKKDQGTIVTIRLPLAPQEPRKKRMPKRKKRDAQILFIEDENIIMEILSQLLVSKGYKVIHAVSGWEGLNHLKKRPFDMVIVGSGMPDVEAEKLATEIRSRNKTLPLALIVEHDGLEEMNRSKVPAVDLLITKPINMNDAVIQISELLMFGGESREVTPYL